MSIDSRLVEHVAWLARLELTEEEKTSFQEQLNRILAHVRKLEELDVEEVPPTFHVLPELQNVMRPDECRPSMGQEDALALTVDKAEGYYRVPRVLDADPREGASS